MATRPQRPAVRVVGVLGELLITAGVLILLFMGWQVWLGDLLSSNAQTQHAQELSEQWSAGEPMEPGPEQTPTTTTPEPGSEPAEVPPVVALPAQGDPFANMIIPRFGADYVKPVLQGINGDELRAGIGHYPGTQLPGEVGNAAFAAHRTGHGSPFFDFDKFQVGDSVFVEVPSGWYRYAIRSFEYVPETGVGVLDPVPQQPGVAPMDRLLTLTSCNPVHTADERIIAYALFDRWFPRSDGPPAEIAGLVQSNAAS